MKRWPLRSGGRVQRGRFQAAYRCPLCEGYRYARRCPPCRCVADAARRLRRDEIQCRQPAGPVPVASFEVERYSDAVEPGWASPPAGVHGQAAELLPRLRR